MEKLTEKEFEKIAKNLKEVSLSREQKESMLKNIYLRTPSELAPTPSPFAFTFFYSHQRMVGVLAIFVFAFTGTTYAAANSLPGQFLYGVKVDVIEPLKLSLTIGEEAKNEYKIHLLQKRVAEIEELQLGTKFDANSKSKSHNATLKNINALEGSAIFDSNGVNLEVSAEVENYNNIIGESFKIETNLLGKKKSDDSTKEGGGKENGEEINLAEKIESEIETGVEASLPEAVETKTETIKTRTKDAVQDTKDEVGDAVKEVTEDLSL